MEKLLMLWRESCGIFKKGQAQMFMLAILQSARLSLSSMLTYGWVLVTFSMLLVYQVSGTALASPLVSCAHRLISQPWADCLGAFFVGLRYLLLLLLVTTVFLMLFAATRASVERKDIHYYAKYTMGSLYLFYFLLVMPFVFVCPFIGYFLLDGNQGLCNAFKAVGKGLLVVLYCLPVTAFFAAFSGVLLLASFTFRIFMASIAPVATSFVSELAHFFIAYFIPGVVFLVVLQLIISLHSVFYVRLKHTQRQFFF